MRIAVCDDDTVFAHALCKRIESLGQSDILVCAFSSGTDLVREISCGRMLDAVFLDIEMPGLNGLDAARKLRELGGELSIIFLTSHTELAMEGYEVNALRFLPKDCSDKKLTESLQAIRRELGAKPNVVIRQKGEEYVVSPDRIILVQADNNTVHFTTQDGTISARMKLTQALEMLEKASQEFVKVHRCIIVNLRHVSKYNVKEIILDNGETVPISKSCAGEFKEKMFEFVRISAR